MYYYLYSTLLTDVHGCLGLLIPADVHLLAVCDFRMPDKVYTVVQPSNFSSIYGHSFVQENSPNFALDYIHIYIIHAATHSIALLS